MPSKKSVEKSFFRDHFLLFLFSLDIFSSLFTFVLVMLRITYNHNSSYIVRYRPILGLSEYMTGSIANLIALASFSIIVTIAIVLFSYKSYKINRNLSIAILSIGLLLIILDLIVSNSIIYLH